MTNPESPLSSPASQAEPGRLRATGKPLTVILESLAAGLLLLSMALGYVAAYGPEHDRAHAAGAAIAPLILLVLVLAISQAFRGARTRRSRAVIATCTSGILLLSKGASLGREQEARALTEPERNGLAIQGGQLLHQTLGFALPYPGPGFAFNDEMMTAARARLSKAPNMGIWALTSAGSSAIVIVQVVKGRMNSRRSFALFVGGMRNTVIPGASAIRLDSLEWGPASRQYRLAAELQTGAYMKLRCIPSSASHAVPVTVCAVTFAADSTALDFVREQLRFLDH